MSNNVNNYSEIGSKRAAKVYKKKGRPTRRVYL